jgi:hypothetical protein
MDFKQKMFKYGITSRIAFPDNPKRRKEFFEHCCKQNFSKNEYEEMIVFGEKLALIQSLEELDIQCKKIRKFQDDPRYEILQKVITLTESAKKGIEQDRDCSYLVQNIYSLVNEANKIYNEQLSDLGQKFKNGRKRSRNDALKKVMIASIQEYKNETSKLPSAKELWNLIPEDGNIQEKTEDTIYWKRKNGKETSTTFKSFQHRYTKLKKNIIKN